jgi:hypothetical protein
LTELFWTRHLWNQNNKSIVNAFEIILTSQHVQHNGGHLGPTQIPMSLEKNVRGIHPFPGPSSETFENMPLNFSLRDHL